MLTLLLLACAVESPKPAADECIPGQETYGDGIDQDCDGVDNQLDRDGDGSPAGEDCDDRDAERFPGASERCNGVDDNCDGEVPAFESDGDRDGYLSCEDDCDDDDRDVHPGAAERCDGVDADCDGEDEGEDAPTWYADVDGDGWGDDTWTAEGCAAPGGFVAEGGDCDDADADIHPEAQETCDEVDRDCDGRAPYRWDADGDGFYECEDDCDDADATVYAGAPEVCDGVDNDCDGALSAEEADADGDRVPACDDCDDGDEWAGAGFVEVCDGRDQDCDGDVDEDCVTCDVVVPGDASTINGGITVAATGDVVCVQAGTWVETVDFRGAEVTLRGLGGAEGTTIDGDQVEAVVTFDSGEGAGAVLEGFTITNGYGWGGGGGVAIAGASPTLRDLVITGNEGAGYSGRGGGGVLVDGGAPTLTGVRLTDNWAYGYFCGASYGSGGGLALYDADVLLEDVLVQDNSGGEVGVGGGVYVSGGALIAVNVAVRSNSAGDGGGIYVNGDATASLTNVIVEGNRAYYSYWSDSVGGGLASAGSLTATNLVVAGNDADDRDGGLCITGTATFTNTVVSGNTATSEPGGDVSSGTVTFSYSDLHDDVVGATSSLSTDPLFYDAAYHLDPTSPLVDAGDPAILDPDGSTSDIGAFGGPGASSWDLDGDGFPAWWQPGAWDAAYGTDCDDDDATVYPGSGC